MDCPQCGGALETYVLDGQEASVCEDCGYVGIPAEHRGEARRVESWNDALRRFYRAHDTDADPGVEVRPPLSRPGSGSTSESWDEALRRFHARRTSRDDGTEEEEADADETGDGESDGDGSRDVERGDGGESGGGEADSGEAARPSSRAQSQSSAGDS